MFRKTLLWTRRPRPSICGFNCSFEDQWRARSAGEFADKAVRAPFKTKVSSKTADCNGKAAAGASAAQAVENS